MLRFWPLYVRLDDCRTIISRYRISPSPVPNYATIREETCWPMRAVTIAADGRQGFGRSNDDESRPPRVIKMLHESVATVFFLRRQARRQPYYIKKEK